MHMCSECFLSFWSGGEGHSRWRKLPKPGPASRLSTLGVLEALICLSRSCEEKGWKSLEWQLKEFRIYPIGTGE